MNTSQQIQDLLVALQDHPMARLDAMSLLRTFSHSALIIARGQLPPAAKWASIERERVAMRRNLLRLCVQYRINVPVPTAPAGEGVPDASH